MPYINPDVLDGGLTILDTLGDRLDICSAEPTTFALATTAGANSLGNRTALAISAPSARTPSGRRVTVPAIADGTVTTTGTATHWAVTDTVNSRLLATGALSVSQAVTATNTFTLGAFDIGIPAAA